MKGKKKLPLLLRDGSPNELKFAKLGSKENELDDLKILNKSKPLREKELPYSI